MDFQLLIPKDTALEIEVEEARVNDVLGSVTMVRRSDNYLAKPVLLYKPRGIQKSPKGSLLLEANAERIYKNEGLSILSASPDTFKIDIFKPAKVEDTESLRDGIVQTLLQGKREHLTAQDRKNVLDNTILVNHEGVFLINLIEPRNGPIKAEQKKGVKDTPSAESAQLAQGAQLATTAR